MDNKVRQLINENKFNNQIKKYSNKHFFHDHSHFRKIETREDIERADNYVKNTISMYEDIYPLERDDIQELERALGKYEIAVSKVMQCYELFQYDFNDLSKLIENVGIYENKIRDIHFRRMCQD